MIKTKPPFLNPKMARTGTPLPKFEKAVEKIFKYSKMPISGAKKFQAEKKYLVYAKDVVKKLNSDKIRPMDIVKISRRLGKQGILKPGLTKYIEGHLLGTGGGKILTSKMISESGAQCSQSTTKSKKVFNVQEFHERLAERTKKEITRRERSKESKIVEPEVSQEINKIEKIEEMPKWGNSKSAEKHGVAAKKVNSPGSGALRVNTSGPVPYVVPASGHSKKSYDDLSPESIMSPNKLEFNLSDGTNNLENLPSVKDWDRFEAYPEDSVEMSDTPMSKNNDIDE